MTKTIKLNVNNIITTPKKDKKITKIIVAGGASG